MAPNQRVLSSLHLYHPEDIPSGTLSVLDQLAGPRSSILWSDVSTKGDVTPSGTPYSLTLVTWRTGYGSAFS